VIWLCFRTRGERPLLRRRDAIEGWAWKEWAAGFRGLVGDFGGGGEIGERCRWVEGNGAG
jgi:hypothetical protein